MLKIDTKVFIICTALVLVMITQTSYAMHITEGLLQPVHCAVWGILCIPFVALGTRRVTKLMANNRQAIVLLSMAGAFTFVLSALKLPSVSGSSSHMTGLGFAAIILGPSVSSLLAVIVLLFQALLLAHGGLTTLGANTFSLGIAGPIIAFMVYAAFSKTALPKRVVIFTAAALGNLSTYIVTSAQMAIAWPSEAGGVAASFAKFAGIFAVTQIPLAVIEGILTVVLINFITAYGKESLQAIGKDVFMFEQKNS